MSRQFIVFNSPDSMVSDSEVRLMIGASSVLMNQVAIAWDRASAPEILFAPDMLAQKIEPVKNARRFFIINDHNGIRAAVAQHVERGDRPDGFVFTKHILNNGGGVLDSANKKTRATVAASLFQLAAETFINPNGNIWWVDPESGEFIEAKICDPVMMQPVVVTLTLAPPKKPETSADVDRSDVQRALAAEPENPEHPAEVEAEPPREPDVPDLVDVSEPEARVEPEAKANAEPEQKEVKIDVALCNFVLPAWFDPSTPAGDQVDFLNLIKAPFCVGTGGCGVAYESNAEHVLANTRFNFDRKVPQWRRELRKMQMAAHTALLQANRTA